MACRVALFPKQRRGLKRKGKISRIEPFVTKVCPISGSKQLLTQSMGNSYAVGPTIRFEI